MPQNSLMQDDNSDISSEGFDVSEGLELDEAYLSDYFVLMIKF